MLSRDEFDRAAQEALPKLRNVLRKMVGQREQCDDLVQESLTKAWEHLASFQDKARFSTWLCAIAVNCAQDFLRSQQRWRGKAQIIYADQCIQHPELGMEVGQSFQDPAISFDTKEHIAYCFSCVGRSLEPTQQAALVLKDVLEMTSMEAARALGISEPVFRQHLTAARSAMQQQYEGMCALVNKQGICYQCAALREGFPEQRRDRWPLDDEQPLAFDLRVNMVREADIDCGKTQLLHEVFWRRTEQLERDGIGDESVQPDCSKGVATE